MVEVRMDLSAMQFYASSFLFIGFGHFAKSPFQKVHHKYNRVFFRVQKVEIAPQII